MKPSKRTAAIAAKILASNGLSPARMTTKPTTKAYSRNWTLQWSDLKALARLAIDKEPKP